MDSGEAAIAAVFGSLTGFEAAPMLFEALLPWVTYPGAKSEKGRGKRAHFAKLLGANLHAPSPRTSRTSLTRVADSRIFSVSRWSAQPAWRPSSLGLSIPPTLRSRHEVPLHLSTGNTEDKHKAGIPQSSPAGAHPDVFRHDHHRRSDDGGIGEPQQDRLRREQLPCRQPGIQSQRARGQGAGGARSGWSASLQPQMVRSATA